MNGPVLSTSVALVAGATQIVVTGPGVYCGVIARETAGTACVLRVWDNASAASGTLLDIVALAANGTGWIPPLLPISYRNGVFIERVSGTTYEGSVRLA